jgi:hypothetical protein
LITFLANLSRMTCLIPGEGLVLVTPLLNSNPKVASRRAIARLLPTGSAILATQIQVVYLLQK